MSAIEEYAERAVPRMTAGDDAEERKAVRAEVAGVEETMVAREAICFERAWCREMRKGAMRRTSRSSKV